jgi:glycosyltransferase involved in cell wall biosynthesis
MDKNNEKEDFILFATADWDTPYWTNKQHMANEFARLGHRVLYIESIGLRKPRINSGLDLKRIFHRLKRGLNPPKKVDSLIWVLSPLVLPYGHGNKWIGRFNQWMMEYQLRKFFKRHKFVNPYIWTYHPFVIELIRKLEFKNKIIYHCVDDLSAVPGVDKKSFNIEEKRFLKIADIVFVTSKILEKKCSNFNTKTFYFPNVVDFKHFSKAQKKGDLPHDLKKISAPRIVYMGALSEFKIDLKLLHKLIKVNQEYNFIFIGDEIEGQANKILKKISAYSNAYFLGFKPYEQLPDYLRGMNIGLIPLKENNYTKSISPMKLFEYIASGLPVVTHKFKFDIANSKKIIYSTSQENFIEAIKVLIIGGKLTYNESKQLVGKNTWEYRTKAMLALLNK